MTTYNPIFRSPVNTLHPPSSSFQPPTATHSVRLSDLSGVPVMLIQGEIGGVLKQHFSAIPNKPGDLVEVEGGLLTRLTPREFYLFGLSLGARLISAATLEETFVRNRLFAHATDYTHGKAVLRLAGVWADRLLSKICGLDFYDTAFPDRHVAQTSAAKIKTLIARRDETGTPVYFLHVNRPFGQYFWEVIWDAGQEFGINSRI